MVVYPAVLQTIFQISFSKPNLTPVSMVLLIGMNITSILKLVSFFAVLNRTRDVLKTISIKKLTEESRMQILAEEKISTSNFKLLMEKPDLNDHLCLKEFTYYVFMPTLCYQLRFPRTETIRIGWLLRRTLEFLVSAMLFL